MVFNIFYCAVTAIVLSLATFVFTTKDYNELEAFAEEVALISLAGAGNGFAAMRVRPNFRVAGQTRQYELNKIAAAIFGLAAALLNVGSGSVGLYCVSGVILLSLLALIVGEIARTVKNNRPPAE